MKIQDVCLVLSNKADFPIHYRTDDEIKLFKDFIVSQGGSKKTVFHKILYFEQAATGLCLTAKRLELGYPERCHNYCFTLNCSRLHYFLLRSSFIYKYFEVFFNLKKIEVVFHLKFFEVVFHIF